jgi:HlyD family secretion protein
MTRKTKIITGIAAVLLAGGATLGLTRRDKDVTPVTFAKVDRADLTSKVTSNGRIDAKRKVDLSANIMGQIVNLAVREGDVVKKNDFLLQIDRKQLAASAQGAAASLQALFSDRDAAARRSPNRSCSAGGRSSAKAVSSARPTSGAPAT